MFEGMRVMVMDASMTKALGEGKLVGMVSLWGWLEKKDGEAWMEYSEEKPEGKGAFRIPSNPKIELDSGKIVYGCQCWWSFWEDEKSPFVPH